MRNLKTTIASLISAVGSFVLFAHQLGMIIFPTWAIAIALFMNIGGFAAFGITAKDYNTSGTGKK